MSCTLGPHLRPFSLSNSLVLEGETMVNSQQTTEVCFEQRTCFENEKNAHASSPPQVYDRAGGLSAAAGADPLLGHCRVPLYRVSPKR